MLMSIFSTWADGKVLMVLRYLVDENLEYSSNSKRCQVMVPSIGQQSLAKLNNVMIEEKLLKMPVSVILRLICQFYYACLSRNGE